LSGPQDLATEMFFQDYLTYVKLVVPSMMAQIKAFAT
jgi:hypothetical protein